MLLSELENGESCLIKEVRLVDNLKKRLLELGVMEKSTLKIIRKSYRNSPIIFMVKQTFLAIRRCDAENIVVEKL